MVGPAAVSAAGNVATFVINQSVNSETDSAVLSKLLDFSKNNAVLGATTNQNLFADSPMVECLTETAGNGETACPAGIAYVFFERKSQGKSSAARYFCRQNCKSSGCRSILVGATGSEETYFQRVATNLGVDFYTSNWARCLVSAMEKSPDEQFNPFLFLDEFNRGTERDLQDLNTFMRACQDQGFYLIIITSDRVIADNVMSLNSWGKIRPLKYIHNGAIENIKGQPGYDVKKTANWKEIDWTHEQLKNLIIKKEGAFEDYKFIVVGMTPTDAVFRARELRVLGRTTLANTAADLSAGD
eukprot:scaffold52547_cov57-Attheya_sp.AAC.1